MIRRINISSGLVTTIAGSVSTYPSNFGSSDGSATRASFLFPENVAVDADGRFAIIVRLTLWKRVGGFFCPHGHSHHALLSCLTKCTSPRSAAERYCEQYVARCELLHGCRVSCSRSARSCRLRRWFRDGCDSMRTAWRGVESRRDVCAICEYQRFVSGLSLPPVFMYGM